MLERWRPTPPTPAEGSNIGGRAAKAIEEAQLHQLDAQLRAVVDQADSESLSDALTTALEEEFSFFDYAASMAGDSPFKLELLRAKVVKMSQKNNRRIDRRHP